MPAPFERLKVWQLSYELALEIYQCTRPFPTEERYGLTSQLRRAAASIPTNIAEGNARSHRREYLHLCFIARGSIAEVKCLLKLGLDLEYIPLTQYEELLGRYELLGALLHRFITKMEAEF